MGADKFPTLPEWNAEHADLSGGLFCSRPPSGWFCQLRPGHDGPCPAYKLRRRPSRAERRTLRLVFRYCRLKDATERARLAAVAAHAKWADQMKADN